MKENTREQTTLRLPRELEEKLHLEAAERGISFNSEIMAVLSEARIRQEKFHHVLFQIE